MSPAEPTRGWRLALLPAPSATVTSSEHLEPTSAPSHFHGGPLSPAGPGASHAPSLDLQQNVREAGRIHISKYQNPLLPGILFFHLIGITEQPSKNQQETKQTNLPPASQRVFLVGNTEQGPGSVGRAGVGGDAHAGARVETAGKGWGEEVRRAERGGGRRVTWSREAGGLRGALKDREASSSPRWRANRWPQPCSARRSWWEVWSRPRELREPGRVPSHARLCLEGAKLGNLRGPPLGEKRGPAVDNVVSRATDREPSAALWHVYLVGWMSEPNWKGGVS